MDLIYTDTNHNDVGVLKDYTFDLAYGSDENDFELVLDLNHHCCEPGCLIYIEGTEYGGIIDTINVVTKDNKLSYKGRTWHGVLASKIIEPPEGYAYAIHAGDANAVIHGVIERIGLLDLFDVSSEDSGMRIKDYAFDRYVDAYSGINKMLTTVSGKLKFTFTNDKVVISAVPIVDYSKDERFDNDQIGMQIEKAYNSVNHLICLGKGELTNRQVVHLYRDAQGSVSKTQTFFGLQEVVEVLDYPNAESTDELIKSGTQRLQEFNVNDKVQLDFTSEETIYDVGDIVGAMEIVTGIIVNKKINKKVVTINQGLVNIQYKVGE